ncbi:MAG: hypothetical protein SFT90_01955 [Rickettsiales bacterium]|nr:hypothetical protein [Rickettsiales bacterium]
MKNILKIFILFLFAIIYLPNNSYAGPPPPNPNEERRLNFTDVCQSPAIKKPNRITGNVVRCIEVLINNSADSIIDKYIAGFATFVFYLTMMAILFFSIKAMFGQVSTRSVSLVFIFKVALVLSITSPQSADYLKGVRDTMVTSPKYFSVVILNSMLENPVEVNDEESVKVDIFDTFDKYILKLFGVENADQKFQRGNASTTKEEFNKQRREELFIGLFALVAGLFFTGGVGATITTIALGFVTTLLFAMAQAILFYATITIALNFLIAISPLAAVALLFDQFKKISFVWFTSFIGYAVQPLIFVSFLGLTLLVLDKLTTRISGPYEKARIQFERGENGEIKLFDCGNYRKSADEKAEDANSNTGDAGESQRQAEGLGGDVSSKSEGCKFYAPKLKLGEGTGLNHNDISELSGNQLAVIFLMIVMLGFMKQIPDMMNKITSEAIVAPVSGVAIGGGQGGINEKPILATQKILTTGKDVIQSAVRK